MGLAAFGKITKRHNARISRRFCPEYYWKEAGNVCIEQSWSEGKNETNWLSTTSRQGINKKINYININLLNLQIKIIFIIHQNNSPFKLIIFLLLLFYEIGLAIGFSDGDIVQSNSTWINRRWKTWKNSRVCSTWTLCKSLSHQCLCTRTWSLSRQFYHKSW